MRYWFGIKGRTAILCKTYVADQNKDGFQDREYTVTYQSLKGKFICHEVYIVAGEQTLEYQTSCTD
jgi:hypothetical protein